MAWTMHRTGRIFHHETATVAATLGKTPHGEFFPFLSDSVSLPRPGDEGFNTVQPARQTEAR
jgi:hypothetical protein